jgi:uncharacterized membrane protein YccC
VPACEFVPGRVVTILSTTQEVVIRLKRPLEQQAEFVWTSFEPFDRADSAAQQRDDHWIDERSGGGRTQAGRPRARRARVAHRELLVDRMLPVPTSRKLELLPHELLDIAGVFSRATLAAGMAPIVP